MKHFGIKGMAIAAGLSLAALASPASAAFQIKLNSSTMVTDYKAYIVVNGQSEHAYSNGVTFNVTNLTGPDAGETESLFGFCIDVYHNMYLSNDLGYVYTSTYGTDTPPEDLLTTDYGGNPLSDQQAWGISTLVDIGFLLHRDHPGALSDLKTAAIQAAIWQTITGAVTLDDGTQSFDGGAHTYASYYHDYVALAQTATGDRIFTITDTQNDPFHQTFAVGWPPVPEPATWALMIMGFMGTGVALRRRKAALA